MSVAGGLRGGQAQADTSSYQAEVARNNAIIADQQADHAVKVGQQKAAMKSMEGASKAGRVRAAIAANGIDVNTGSAVDLKESQREAEKLDTETVLSNAQLDAYGYRSRAANERAQANIYEVTGKRAKEGAEIGAVGTLLSKASALPWKWLSGDGTTGAAAPAGSGTLW